MKGLILAAGKGTRLYPVTKAVPKPLLPMANRMTMAYAFDRLKECGINEICVVVGENEAAMREALGTGSAFDVQLSFVRQTEPQGLAHAVGFARDFMGSEPFVLYLGDAIYSDSLKPFVDRFFETGCANLNLVKHVEDPRRFGVANVEDDRIVKLVEKPKEPESNWAMAAMYVFGPQIWEVLPKLKPSARGEYEITDAIQMMIDEGEDVRAGFYEGQWFDTGTLESYLATSRYLVGDEPLLAEGSGVQGNVGAHVVVGPGALVECDSIRDTVVLPGAKIRVKGAIHGCLLGGEVTADHSLKQTIKYGDLE